MIEVDQNHPEVHIEFMKNNLVVQNQQESSVFRNSAYPSSRWVSVAEINYSTIPSHTIYSDLGPSALVALTLFHNLARCDTTSQIHDCSKTPAWAAWISIPNLNDTLVGLPHEPDIFCPESLHMQQFECFIVLMYNKYCGAGGVNETRHRLFSTANRSLENIPPTHAVLS